ncbi:MAG: flagellar basal body protein FliL [Treponema sp.]|jgi:flagellar basal body-associated protein FliL|nr:flagellar basal body protein FliL [Treponema sp.]
MKSGGKDPSLVLVIIYRALLILLFFLGLLLLGGTLYALVFLPPGEGAETGPPAGEERLFAGIGRIRVSAGDDESPTVIVRITFPYPAADKPFSEELASRVRDFRTIAADYFGSFSAAALASADEDTLKEELLSRYNSILRLGKIKVLYFDDFFYLE